MTLAFIFIKNNWVLLQKRGKPRGSKRQRDIENKLVVTSGGRKGEGQDRGRGIRGTNYDV